MPKQDQATAEEKPPRLEKRLEELHQTYFRSLQEVYGDSQKQSIEAYRDYARVVQDAFLQGDAQSRVRDAHFAYLKAIDDLRPKCEKRVQESFRTYVHGLQQSLGQTDVAAIDPAALAMLSQSTSVIANHAACHAAGTLA